MNSIYMTVYSRYVVCYYFNAPNKEAVILTQFPPPSMYPRKKTHNKYQIDFDKKKIKNLL